MRRALCGMVILVLGVAAGCAPSVPGGRVKFANLATRRVNRASRPRRLWSRTPKRSCGVPSRN